MPGRVAAGCQGVAGAVPGQCRVAWCCRVPGCCRVLPGAAGCCQAVRMCVDFQVLPGAAGCCRVAGLEAPPRLLFNDGPEA